MQHSSTSWNSNAMVVFWLGLLTGALVVGFIFLYRLLNQVDYQNAVLNSTYSSSYKLNTSLTSPYSMGTPQL